MGSVWGGAFLLYGILSAVTANQLALLAGTLRTFQRHACDHTSLSLQCPNNTTIDITFARYGRPRTAQGAGGARDPCPPLPHHSPLNHKSVCEYPQAVNYNTLQLVVKACQHHQQCKIDVEPHTFSTTDPCPLTRKYIEVAYKCRPETFINKVVCEGGELDLECERDSRLAIYSVLFGRSQSGSFSCPQPSGVPEEECQASYANEIVMSLCHGQRQCHLKASTDVFGTPCSPESTMYMKTVYTCVPKKILKTTQQDDDDYNDGSFSTGDGEGEERGVGGQTGEEEGGLEKGDFEEGSLRSPAAPPPSVPPSSPRHTLSPPSATTTSFYNPTVTTWLSDKKSEEPALPPRRPPPSEDMVPHSQPELINCTVTILAGSRDKEIGFLTEWMRAVAFIKKNFEKFLLYLLLGLFVGLVLFLFVVVGQLLWERRKAKRAAKMLHDPLTSVFAADIDDIDGDLDLDGAGDSGGVLGSSLPRSPSPQDSSAPREVLRYNTYNTAMRARHEGDGNPRSLTRNNNNQLFYS